ncbi:MAG: response regulator transcription factor [Lachnospiraceae bacterium]|nr:response regulator transcription factor [Lachnospiraceae bacterium]
MYILVAEDDVDLNEIIVKKLKAEGFKVDNCFDGEEAFERIGYANYDVAVMDIMMPKMDGTTALSKLRENGNTTPVIFLTAKDTIADKVKGLNLGANDYVVKPFSFDELIARIIAVNRTASGNTSAILELADLTLDMESHIVKRGGKEISLTGKEYALLEYLLINKNRIMSREKILSHVWGYDYEGGEKIVDVYMNYLRKKIDGEEEKKLIHTARGIGYVMKEEKEDV